jgi:hypothetical protein
VTVGVDVVDHQVTGGDGAGAALVNGTAGLVARALAGQRDLGASEHDLVMHLASRLATPTVGLVGTRRQADLTRLPGPGPSHGAVAAVVQLDDTSGGDGVEDGAFEPAGLPQADADRRRERVRRLWALGPKCPQDLGDGSRSMRAGMSVVMRPVSTWDAAADSPPVPDS